MAAMAQRWLSDTRSLTVGARQEDAGDRIPPYAMLTVLAEQWLGDGIDESHSERLVWI